MIDFLSERLGRKLLTALRHHPEEYGLRMNSDGWVDVLDVGDAINQILRTETRWDRDSVQRSFIDLGLIDRVQFSSDYCRTMYGHSTPCFNPKSETVPETSLFHGTSGRNLSSISCFGLHSMRRRFVQLTTDFDYANKIAEQHGDSPVVFQVSLNSAIEAGVRFYSTRSHVWLATSIPFDCLEIWMTQAPIVDDDSFDLFSEPIDEDPFPTTERKPI